jgi:chaperonin GroEL
LKNHLDGLVTQANEADHPFSREKLLTRHSRLAQHMASIYIGGFSEAEIRETRERVDDAVNATRLAIKGGVVVGAGWTLYTIARQYPFAHEQAEAGAFADALKTPMNTLHANGAPKEHALKWGEEYYLNTKTGEMQPTAEAEVLDPALVVLNSLKAAVSIARLVLTTDTIILAEPKGL